MENPLFKYDFSWNSVGETLNKDEWDNSGLPVMDSTLRNRAKADNDLGGHAI